MAHNATMLLVLMWWASAITVVTTCASYPIFCEGREGQWTPVVLVTPHQDQLYDRKNWRCDIQGCSTDVCPDCEAAKDVLGDGAEIVKEEKCGHYGCYRAEFRWCCCTWEGNPLSKPSESGQAAMYRPGNSKHQNA